MELPAPCIYQEPRTVLHSVCTLSHVNEDQGSSSVAGLWSVDLRGSQESRHLD